MAAARATKNNSYEDTIAFDEPCDLRAGHGWVGDLLKQLKSATPALSLLFPLSLAQLERLHREASHALSLQALQLTPHS